MMIDSGVPCAGEKAFDRRLRRARSVTRCFPTVRLQRGSVSFDHARLHPTRETRFGLDPYCQAFASTTEHGTVRVTGRIGPSSAKSLSTHDHDYYRRDYYKHSTVQNHAIEVL